MRRSAKLLPFSLLFALVACQTQAPYRVVSGLRLASEFDAVHPSQIAILPIEDGTPDRSFGPLADLARRAAERELPQRGYAPLAPGYVDAKLTAIGRSGTGSPLDAAWLGGLRNAFQEDAVLGVRVVSWNTNKISETRQVAFSVEVLMLASGTGAVLWSGRLEGDVKAGGDGPSPLTRDQRIESAAEVMARILVRELPIRTPRT